VIDSLRVCEDTDARTIADRSGVSLDTARRVLQVAEDDGLFDRDGDHDHIYQVDVGPLAQVEDDEYRRLILDLLAESKED
jgi:hypothetical protein